MGTRRSRQIGVAVAVGAVVGFLLQKATRLAGAERLAEEDWFPLASIGASITVLALAHLLGGTGVFASFIAGLFFSEGMPESLRQPIHVVHRSVTKVGLTVVFIAFGTVLPIGQWWSVLGGSGLVFALWALILRRLPATVPVLLLTRTGWLSSTFMAWSGPLGVAAIYYLAFAERYAIAQYERLFLAGSLCISVSVFGHAVTSALAVRAYSARLGIEASEGDQLELDGELP